MDKFPLKLAFDDILLLPQYSAILPSLVDVSTRFTKRIKLNIPLVSAAMDTVTEHKLAIQMALQGGIGIIHKNLSIQNQAEEVKLVKRFESGFITEPITLSPDHTIEDAYKIREEKGYKTIPITDTGRHDGKLVGLITSDTYFLTRHRKCKVKERMLPPKELLVAQEGVSLEKAHDILEESKHSKLLIVNSKKEMKLIALVTRKDLDKKEKYPLAATDKNGRLLTGAALSPGKELQKRARALKEAGVDVLIVDTAHGHSKGVADAVKYLKKTYKNIEVIAGNVATREGVQALKKAGADAVKVGIGPGSICTTRIITGIGVPQFSAILECAKEAKKLDMPIIADGGIKYSGDLAKALAAGADTAMIGNLFAGTLEAPGEIVYSEGKTYKAYRGMGSLPAMKKGGKDRYNQANIEEPEKLVPEGIEGLTLYKGSIVGEIYQLIGGLKSSMGYQGVKNIKELHKKAKFIQITEAALKESHPHDIVLQREAPNYRKP